MSVAAKFVPHIGFRDRLLDAWLGLQRARRDRVTQGWIAREMAKRDVSMTQSGISGWFRGEATPSDTRTYVVLAEVLSWGERGKPGWVDPGWLAFGDDSLAPPPEIGAWGTPMAQPEGD